MYPCHRWDKMPEKRKDLFWLLVSEESNVHWVLWSLCLCRSRPWWLGSVSENKMADHGVLDFVDEWNYTTYSLLCLHILVSGFLRFIHVAVYIYCNFWDQNHVLHCACICTTHSVKAFVIWWAFQGVGLFAIVL